MLDAVDDITLFELGLFADIGRRQSLRSVARGRSLRASHVSKALSRLERKLKRQLLKRSASGVVLTPDGERVLAVVRSLVEQADRLRGKAEAEAKPEQQLVTLGAVRFLCARLLAPVVGELEKTAPALRFRILDFSPDLVVNAGLKGAFEVAITLNATAWTKAWEVLPLGDLRWKLYGRAGHPLGAKTKAASVKQHPFVIPNYWSGDGFERGDDYCPMPLDERRSGHEASSILTAIEIVEATDQLVFAPEIACRRAVREKRLMAIHVTGWKPVRKPLFLVVKADAVSKHLQTRLAAAFAAHLVE